MHIKFFRMLNYVGNEIVPDYRVLVIHLLELPLPQSNFLIDLVNKSTVTNELVKFLGSRAEVMMIVVLCQIQLNVFEFSL